MFDIFSDSMTKIKESGFISYQIQLIEYYTMKSEVHRRVHIVSLFLNSHKQIPNSFLTLKFEPKTKSNNTELKV